MLRLMNTDALLGSLVGCALTWWLAMTILPPHPKIEMLNSFNSPARKEVRAAVTLEFEHQLSLRMARSQYPDLLDASSALAEAVAAREQALQDNDDPLLNDGDYPMTLADEEAEQLGIAPVPPVVWRKW